MATVRRHFIDLLTPEQVRMVDTIAQTVLAALASDGEAEAGCDRQTE